MITFQISQTTVLPYTTILSDTIQASLKFIGLNTVTASKPTCLIKGTSTIAGIFLDLVSVALTCSWCVVLVVFQNIQNRGRLVQIMTLLVFLCLSPLFDVVARIIMCQEIWDQETETTSYRANFFAETECYQWYNSCLPVQRF